ncbi:MAG: hypothetical protein SVW77_01455, partial [Candidatus Nanohaloarchaea archaeon]|nr:hypothetical protein [Candidatus Nanohaloarchaea archaeon]
MATRSPGVGQRSEARGSGSSGVIDVFLQPFFEEEERVGLDEEYGESVGVLEVNDRAAAYFDRARAAGPVQGAANHTYAEGAAGHPAGQLAAFESFVREHGHAEQTGMTAAQQEAVLDDDLLYPTLREVAYGLDAASVEDDGVYVPDDAVDTLVAAWYDHEIGGGRQAGPAWWNALEDDGAAAPEMVRDIVGQKLRYGDGPVHVYHDDGRWEDDAGLAADAAAQLPDASLTDRLPYT